MQSENLSSKISGAWVFHRVRLGWWLGFAKMHKKDPWSYKTMIHTKRKVLGYCTCNMLNNCKWRVPVPFRETSPNQWIMSLEHKWPRYLPYQVNSLFPCSKVKGIKKKERKHKVRTYFIVFHRMQLDYISLWNFVKAVRIQYGTYNLFCQF